MNNKQIKLFAIIGAIVVVLIIAIILLIPSKSTSDENETEVLPVHSCDYAVRRIQPTCTDDGYTLYECSCGDSYTKNFVAPLGHRYHSVVTKPTCTEDGYTTYTCDCGDTYTINKVSAKGHDYNEKVLQPTCTEDGYTIHTCHCGDSYVTDEVTATGHHHNANVLAPTCTTEGFTTYTCDCGDTYITDEIAALGHVYSNEIVKPTCTEDGYTIHICHCGDTYVDSQVAAPGHYYDRTIEQPTCTKSGGTTFTCECGDSYIVDEVPMIEHSYDNISVTDPTCTKPGITTFTCICGDFYTVENASATGHTYREIINPTCTENGYIYLACGCYSDTDNKITLPMRTHQYVDGLCISCKEQEMLQDNPDIEVDENIITDPVIVEQLQQKYNSAYEFSTDYVCQFVVAYDDNLDVYVVLKYSGDHGDVETDIHYYTFSHAVATMPDHCLVSVLDNYLRLDCICSQRLLQEWIREKYGNIYTHDDNCQNIIIYDSEENCYILLSPNTMIDGDVQDGYVYRNVFKTPDDIINWLKQYDTQYDYCLAELDDKNIANVTHGCCHNVEMKYKPVLDLKTEYDSCFKCGCQQLVVYDNDSEVFIIFDKTGIIGIKEKLLAGDCVSFAIVNADWSITVLLHEWQCCEYNSNN